MSAIPETDLQRALRHGPFPAALHLAIEARDLSLEALQTRLLERGVAVSLSTLSYWRRGRSRPERDTSLRAVTALEEILGLPRDSLAGLLGPRRARGRWLDRPVGAVPLAKLWRDPQTLAEIYCGLPDDRLERVSVEDEYTVDADGRAESLDCRLCVRAEDDRVARCLIAYWAEDREGVAPGVTGTRHCRPGRVRDAEGFTVVELVLDRVLSRGETAVIGYSLRLPAQKDPVDDFSRRFVRPVREYALTVVFDQARLPSRCVGYQRLSVDGPDRWTEELWPSRSGAAQLVFLDTAPSLVGIRWDW